MDPFLATVVFNLFYKQVKTQLLGTKWVFKHQDLQMFGFKFTRMSNFHPLEIAGRYRDPQLQVGENLNKIF